MFRELTDTMESITAEDPLILLLEDLHWSIAEQLLAVARKGSDTGLQLQAHHAAWATAHSRGELQAAMDHTSEGLRLYDSRLHAMTASTYGDHDAGVC